MDHSNTDREENVILIAGGMIGFPGLNRYRLIEREEENPFRLLQSEEMNQIRFSLIDPLMLRPDYQVSLIPEQLEELQIENRGDADVYVVVSVPADPRKITVNLRAPFVVNEEIGVGMQIVLQDESLPVSALLADEWKREEAEMFQL